MEEDASGGGGASIAAEVLGIMETILLEATKSAEPTKLLHEDNHTQLDMLLDKITSPFMVRPTLFPFLVYSYSYSIRSHAISSRSVLYPPIFYNRFRSILCSVLFIFCCCYVPFSPVLSFSVLFLSIPYCSLVICCVSSLPFPSLLLSSLLISSLLIMVDHKSRSVPTVIVISPFIYWRFLLLPVAH